DAIGDLMRYKRAAEKPSQIKPVILERIKIRNIVEVEVNNRAVMLAGGNKHCWLAPKQEVARILWMELNRISRHRQILLGSWCAPGCHATNCRQGSQTRLLPPASAAEPDRKKRTRAHSGQNGRLGFRQAREKPWQTP